MRNNTNYKIDIKYIFIILIAVFGSTMLHELAHWSVGEILGNKMVATLNGTSAISGNDIPEWKRNWTTLAGPLFTILQAIVFFYLLKKYKNISLYPFLFFPFVMRFFAGLANFLGANDEGRLGLSFGIGLFTLSIFVCSFLFLLVFKTSKDLKISFKFNSINFLFCFLFLLLLTFIDAKFKIKLI